MTQVPLGGRRGRGGVVVPGGGRVQREHVKSEALDQLYIHNHIYIVSSMMAFTMSLSFALRAFIAFLRDTFDC